MHNWTDFFLFNLLLAFGHYEGCLLSRWHRPLSPCCCKWLSESTIGDPLVADQLARAKQKVMCLVLRVETKSHSLENIFPPRVRSNPALWCHKLPGKWQKCSTMGVLSMIGKSPESGRVNYGSLGKIFITPFLEVNPFFFIRESWALRARSDLGGYVCECFCSKFHGVGLICVCCWDSDAKILFVRSPHRPSRRTSEGMCWSWLFALG